MDGQWVMMDLSSLKNVDNFDVKLIIEKKSDRIYSWSWY